MAYFPHEPAGWRTALTEVAALAMDNHCFFAPDPRMFSSIQTIERLRKYVASWILVRDEWMKRVQNLRVPPACSTTKRWKVFFMGFYRKEEEDTSKDKQITQKGQDRQMIADFLGLKSLPAIIEDHYSAKWNGRELVGSVEKVITDTVIRDVIRDLHSCNFYFDLLRLETHLSTGLSSEEILRRVTQAVVCPSNTSDKPSDGNIGGVAWKERLPAVIALASVMEHWPEYTIQQGEREKAMSSSPQQVAHVLLLERKVARCYCFQMVKVFRRIPVVPAMP